MLCSTRRVWRRLGGRRQAAAAARRAKEALEAGLRLKVLRKGGGGGRNPAIETADSTGGQAGFDWEGRRGARTHGTKDCTTGRKEERSEMWKK